MATLRHFWRALETLPGAAAERLEWRRLLGDDWPIVEPLLRQTGALVERVWCPSPGGVDCPRLVVRHSDKRIVAVCGDEPRNCEKLCLSLEDIAVLELDTTKLAEALVEPLGMRASSRWIREPEVLELGRHMLHAGQGIPIILFLSQASGMASQDVEMIVRETQAPFAIATPTEKNICPATRSKIKASGGIHILLCDEVDVGEGDKFAGRRAPAEIFAVFHERTTAEPQQAWCLPPDARWEELTFEFMAEEVINIGFRSQVKRFEPEQLGMKNAKNGRPTLQWALLKQMAKAGGQLTWADQGSGEKIKKQKQELSKKLRKMFGIDGDPITWTKGAYVARFVLRAGRLQ